LKARFFTGIAWLLAAAAGAAGAECRVTDFEVRLARWQWVNGCALNDCQVLKGMAVLDSKCSDSAAAIVRITGLDAAGAPVASRELMPFTRDVPAGEHPFSIDLWLDHDPAIAMIRLDVVELYRFAR
jgi:hypothetical protein